MRRERVRVPVIRWLDVAGTSRTTGLIVIGRIKADAMETGLDDIQDENTAKCTRIEQSETHFLSTPRTVETGSYIAISIYIRAQKEDNPNMNVMEHARDRLTRAHQTVQTMLLIVVTFVGTWIAICVLEIAPGSSINQARAVVRLGDCSARYSGANSIRRCY